VGDHESSLNRDPENDRSTPNGVDLPDGIADPQGDALPAGLKLRFIEQSHQFHLMLSVCRLDHRVEPQRHLLALDTRRICP
jgi:hypothetical protein